MNMRRCISIYVRVSQTLARLQSRNALIMSVDLCGITHNTTSIILREYCEVMRPFIFKTPTLARMGGRGGEQKKKKEKRTTTTSNLEDLHDISYVLGAIDKSHVPIIAHSWDSI